ncbi:hypothetical protein DV711_06240 [Motiliproteus coralliicola]|uniref:Uncharacterized protein n=1 Tax=Motiliproteus coralliicola TaxID=2283196 RepID=A0A369WTZ9_9GAMM|nr:hypothetical protein [Motiliproteus coralliicola]RDE25152.1 hypothetical protein DV711_06240 [Motiliproteus coralliicola]
MNFQFNNQLEATASIPEFYVAFTSNAYDDDLALGAALNNYGFNPVDIHCRDESDDEGSWGTDLNVAQTPFRHSCISEAQDACDKNQNYNSGWTYAILPNTHPVVIDILEGKSR